MLNAFNTGNTLRDIGSPRVGLQTSNNSKFLRLWFEVSIANSCFDATDCINAFAGGRKWFPHNKGGVYKKWFGNLEYVINYQDNGKDLRSTLGAAVIPDKYLFQEAITYSRLNGGNISFRLQPKGCIFDSASVDAFISENDIQYLLALLNTVVIREMVKIISPTINVQPGDIAKLPILFNDDSREKAVKETEENIAIAKSDWASFEESWDFKKHPLI